MILTNDDIKALYVNGEIIKDGKKIVLDLKEPVDYDGENYHVDFVFRTDLEGEELNSEVMYVLRELYIAFDKAYDFDGLEMYARNVDDLQRKAKKRMRRW